jgi:hypothetical protein
METGASDTDEEICEKRSKKTHVVTMLKAATNSLVGEIHVGEVCHSIDKLCDICRRIVVLFDVRIL